MKYCTNCGNELNGEKFCTKCGASTGIDTIAAVNESAADKKALPGKLILVGIIVVAVAAVLFAFSGRSYKAVVKKYVNASVKGDGEKIVSLMPKSLVNFIAKEEFDGDKEEMIFSLEESLDSMVDMLDKYDVNLSKISYKILETDDMDKDDIGDLKDKYRRAKLNIKKGKELKVELKIPVDGKERTNSIYMDVVKIGRSWYLVDMF